MTDPSPQLDSSSVSDITNEDKGMKCNVECPNLQIFFLF